MGNWVAVAGPMDLEAIRSFGEEICIEPDKSVARAIDTDGDGEADQVINFAPTFCPMDIGGEIGVDTIGDFSPASGEGRSVGLSCDENALEIFSMDDGYVSHPIFTSRVTEGFPSTCGDGTSGCTTFKSAEYYVGHFIPGDPAEQLAVINPDGSVQVFAWEPDIVEKESLAESICGSPWQSEKREVVDEKNRAAYIDMLNGYVNMKIETGEMTKKEGELVMSRWLRQLR